MLLRLLLLFLFAIAGAEHSPPLNIHIGSLGIDVFEGHPPVPLRLEQHPPPPTRFDFSHLSRAYTSNDAAALLRQLPDLRDDFEVAADGTTVAGWGLAGEHVAAPDSSELSLEQARTFMGLAAELPQPLPTNRNREAFFRLLGRTLTGISLRSGIEPRNEQPPGGELHHAIGILAPTTGCKVTTYRSQHTSEHHRTV